MNADKLARKSKYEINKNKSKRKAKAQSIRDKKKLEEDESRKRRHINSLESQKRIKNYLQEGQRIRAEEAKS